MKKIAFAVFAVAFCMMLFSCYREKTIEGTDPLETLQDMPCRYGVALGDKSLEFVVDPTMGENYLTEDVLFTNTKEIEVSMPDLKEDEEVDVYLYDAENIDVLVGAKRLSATEDSITFSHLKSTVGYRICVEPKNLSESKSLKITD